MVTAEAIAAEMHQTVRSHVLMHRDGSLQRAWEKVARIYGMEPRRVRAYWNGDIRRVPAHEADIIRAAKRAAIRERQKAINDELAALQMRLAALESE